MHACFLLAAPAAGPRHIAALGLQSGGQDMTAWLHGAGRLEDFAFMSSRAPRPCYPVPFLLLCALAGLCCRNHLPGPAMVLHKGPGT
ncbi:hypothetical protein CENSYa_0759 [Cenarchaeum symbiosum A]|uniref:Uncharacterized protein n=1 Tax=Cenarchaeum symbiosum (strain A) TaxID=414004 RepID=A0RVM5_CENSY|nr:hypothetical protein CENSYa_0759 [Cenarchaeum symbiosum A]